MTTAACGRRLLHGAELLKVQAIADARVLPAGARPSACKAPEDPRIVLSACTDRMQPRAGRVQRWHLRGSRDAAPTARRVKSDLTVPAKGRTEKLENGARRRG